MIEINNKYEIGEELYTSVSVPVKYECPICKGEGKFIHNGYEVKCSNCCGTGKIHEAHQCLLEPVKVKIRRIKISVWNNQVTVKYCIDCDKSNVKNRSEKMLFRTLDECEDYCQSCNTQEVCI